MKKSVKSTILKAISKTALKTAKKACGATSWWDCYQPKEPVNLNNIKLK